MVMTMMVQAMVLEKVRFGLELQLHRTKPEGSKRNIQNRGDIRYPRRT